MIFNYIVDQHTQRDMRLTAEAEDAIAESAVSGGPTVDRNEIVLRTRLKVQTILCTEYRYVPMSPSKFLNLTTSSKEIRTSP
jgi:hypothetical protein